MGWLGTATLPAISSTVAPTATVTPNLASHEAATATPSASPRSTDSVWNGLPIRDIIALINLLVVVWIFFQTRSDRRTERTADLQERMDKLRLEIGIFWIQRIILEPNEKLMFEFFSKYSEKLDKLPSTLPAASANVGELTAKVREEIGGFKDDLRVIRRKIEEPLVWISPAFRDLSETIRSVEDLVTQTLQMIPGIVQQDIDEDKPSDRLQKLRREFFERLYSGQKTFTQFDM